MKTTKIPLGISLFIMIAMIVYGLLDTERFIGFFKQPDLYMHAKFIHILSVTLLFANAVIGQLWETRSLLTGKPAIIRHTYETVVWIDAILTGPAILLAATSGILLATVLGGVWTIGWLSVGFTLFLFVGVVWIVLDIPTQYKIKKGFQQLDADAKSLPKKLLKLLWFRMVVAVLGIIPLLITFFLMVHKPNIGRVATWFGGD